MVQKTTSKSFSVLTVSKRTGWYHDALKCIINQTIQPKDWITITEVSIAGHKNMIGDGWRVVEAPEQTKLSNLNASLNAGLKLIDTDYVIFYQDYIELNSDCFEKLLDLVDEKTFVTTCTPNYDGSDDGRYTGTDTPRPCQPEEWEANVAIAPMKMIRELGGFDEEYDWGWSWDNVNLAQRAAMLGAKFVLDESNRPKLLPHEQTSKLEMPLNAERHDKTMQAIRRGDKPLRLSYL